MASLNLLPWRERERERKKTEFIALLLGTLGLGAGLIFLANMYMDNAIANQEARNSFLQNQISVLDKNIEKIKALDATRQALLDRMSIIEDLQGKRPAIVHLFDEVATALPQGMYLTSLTQTGDLIRLTGKAESNARVSSYMNRLDESQWLSSSNLNLIKIEKELQDKSNNSKLRDFSLDVSQKNRRGDKS
ncbi:PilN domain-containing protein [Thiofilum flexile]|uniref:PilN domain-containing protein n=1 Tax=Thiofilum flexile TaxID=125627 RepID=UPI00035D1101|nr:PilN domain-containing protein [Thiofilum flexile]